MVRRLAALPLCLLALAAFSEGERAQLAAACADSLTGRHERGRETPAALLANRAPVCACVAEGVAGEAAIAAGDKPKIARVFALIAAGEMEAARSLRLSLDREVHRAMRRLTRDCAAGHAKPEK